MSDQNEQDIPDTINTEVSAKAISKYNTLLSKRGVLLILSSNYLGETFVIDKPKITIGRSDICDLIINDPLVSKEHCIIASDDEGKFYLEDLGSKNSTYLNEKKLKKKTHIVYADRIIIGQTIIRFFLEEKFD